MLQRTVRLRNSTLLLRTTQRFAANSRRFHPYSYTNTRANDLPHSNNVEPPKTEASGSTWDFKKFLINHWKGILKCVTGLTSLAVAYYYGRHLREDNLHSASILVKHIESDIEKKLETPFKPTTPMILGLPLFRKEGSDILETICAYDCIPQLSYIGGPSNAGKSMTIEKAVEGRKNVVYITLRGHEPRQALVKALGIHKRRSDDPNPSISDLLTCLENVLIQKKECEEQKSDYGTKSNPIPLIIISDHIAENEECKVIAGNVLQFVEKNLASGIHVTSNHNTWDALKLQSGHASRLNKYSFSYTPQEQLEKYEFFQDENIRKLGGHFGDVFYILKNCIPIAKKSGGQNQPTDNNKLVESIVKGEIKIPTTEYKRLVDNKIKQEATGIIQVLRSYNGTSFAVHDAVALLKRMKDGEFTPSTKPEMDICEYLVNNNILNHAFHDPKSYAWNRPILGHAFVSCRDYLNQVYSDGDKTYE